MNCHLTLASFGPDAMFDLMLVIFGPILVGLVVFWWLLGMALKYWGSPKGVRVLTVVVSIVGFLILLATDDDWSLMVGTFFWVVASVRSWHIQFRLNRAA